MAMSYMDGLVWLLILGILLVILKDRYFTKSAHPEKRQQQRSCHDEQSSCNSSWHYSDTPEMVDSECLGASGLARQQINLDHPPLHPDDYNIGNPLGKGGFGTVHEIRVTRYIDQDPPIKPGIYALKKSHFSTEEKGYRPQRVKMARREAYFLTKLEHSKYVVPLYRTWQVSECRYFLLERYPRSLRDYLYPKTKAHRRSYRSVSLEDAREFLIGIASGLRDIHAQDIVHLDLRPANLCLTEKGEIRIIDFSCASAMGENLCRNTFMGGYPNPPELRRSNGADCSAANDIWFFGQVCLELLERVSGLTRRHYDRKTNWREWMENRVDELGVPNEWKDFTDSLLHEGEWMRPNIDTVLKKLRSLPKRDSSQSENRKRSSRLIRMR